MKRIGILGGTFNPIHIGHLAIAQTVCDRLNLDKVLFVPSYYPPHKGHKNVIDTRHRTKMVELAIKHNPRFGIEDFEIKRPGKSYSIDTLKYLHRIYPPKTKFFFIIGSDMVKDLGEWKRIDELLELVQFVVVSRKGYGKLRTKYKAKVVATLDLSVSSSYLRQCLRKNITVRYLLPDNVLYYIKKFRLYHS